MTAAELIESGILEAYVLGAVGQKEAALVDAFREDAAVSAALEELAGLLECFARQTAFIPPDDSVIREVLKGRDCS